MKEETPESACLRFGVRNFTFREQQVSLVAGPRNQISSEMSDIRTPPFGAAFVFRAPGIECGKSARRNSHPATPGHA